MANFVYNIAKGRVAEFFNRVDSNDPSTSAIILVPLSASGTEAEGQDYDTLAAVLAGTANEQTSGGWSRKTLTDSDLSAIAVDDTNNRMPATLPQVTWTGPTAGNDTTGLLICYDADTGSGTDSGIIPLVHCDFAAVADGNDVILNAGDCFRAS